MARANKKPQLIEFKGTTLPVVSVTLYSLQTAPLTKAASELFGDDAFLTATLPCSNSTACWTLRRRNSIGIASVSRLPGKTASI